MPLTERDKEIVKETVKTTLNQIAADNETLWVRKEVALDILKCGVRTLEKLRTSLQIKWRQGEGKTSPVEYNVQSLMDYYKSTNYGLSKFKS
jgi:hypothetical protein